MKVVLLFAGMLNTERAHRLAQLLGVLTLPIQIWSHQSQALDYHGAFDVSTRSAQIP